jgi:hypothetical protein
MRVWRRVKSRESAAVFEGGFGKTWCAAVVFLWSVCGGLRGKRGQLTVTARPAKKTPTFGNIFFRPFFPLFVERVGAQECLQSSQNLMFELPAVRLHWLRPGLTTYHPPAQSAHLLGIKFADPYIKSFGRVSVCSLQTESSRSEGARNIEGSRFGIESVVDANKQHSLEDASISWIVGVSGFGVACLCAGIGGAIH